MVDIIQIMKTQKQKIGGAGEDLAVKYLKKKQWKLLHLNQLKKDKTLK